MADISGLNWGDEDTFILGDFVLVKDSYAFTGIGGLYGRIEQLLDKAAVVRVFFDALGYIVNDNVEGGVETFVGEDWYIPFKHLQKFNGYDEMLKHKQKRMDDV